MKELELARKVYVRLLKGHTELYEKDFESGIRGVTPGEWVLFLSEKGSKFLGYVNPFATNGVIARVLCSVSEEVSLEPQKYLKNAIHKAVTRRFAISDFKEGCRLIHGQADGLTGVICDLYSNCALLQINTSGMDIHRDLISQLISELIDVPVFFLDNKAYRESEVLPSVPQVTDFPKQIEVTENNLRYAMNAEVIQKIGYYYDHRDNRKKLERYIERLNDTPASGLDLFCYAGSWGLHMLRSGVKSVEFVDQGNFQEVIKNNLTLNQFDQDRGAFFRADVFKFLDESISAGKTFDIVVSDPPAFKKKDQNKSKAIGGYTKLHTKSLQVVKEGGLFVAASCTSNVSLQELDRTVTEASLIANRKVHLIDVGVQGADHPITSFDDKGNYIKYILYTVE